MNINVGDWVKYEQTNSWPSMIGEVGSIQFDVIWIKGGGYIYRYQVIEVRQSQQALAATEKGS